MGNPAGHKLPMTLAPRDYIAERRRDISQRMEALKAELKQLDLMESAIADGPLMLARPDPVPNPIAETPPAHRRRRVDGGIKAIIMKVLVPLYPNGMPAKEILVSMKVLFGVDIPRTSLSPQLSRLSKELSVAVSDGKWRATEKGRNTYSKLA